MILFVVLIFVFTMQVSLPNMAGTKGESDALELRDK